MPQLTPPPPTRRRPPRRRPLRSGFASGVAETLSIVVGFVAVGVLAGSWAAERPSPAWPAGAAEVSSTDGYPSRSMTAGADQPELWLVDGFNALHVALLRGRDRHAWWRSEERERLVTQVSGFDAGASDVVVVFDGPRPNESHEAGRPRVVFAPSADDWLLRQIREAVDPGRVAIVTADRQLADRARHRGAQVVSPRAFLERCGSDGESI